MKRKIVLCLLSLLLVVTVPLAATASSVDGQGPVGKPNVSGAPVVTPKPQVTPIPLPHLPRHRFQRRPLLTRLLQTPVL